MTKSLSINPAEVRQSSTLKPAEIPINQYAIDPAKEVEKHGAETLVRLYRDMLFIREFESMLLAFKKEGKYHTIDYVYPGPAHLSIGQAAAVVGQALHLTIDD